MSKAKMALVLLGLTSLFLVGCSGKNTLTIKETKDDQGKPVIIKTYELSDVGMYHFSVNESDKAKADAVVAQAESIEKVDISDQSTDAQALLNRDKIETIGTLKPTDYSGGQPTSVNDIVKTGVEVLPSLAGAGVKATGIVVGGDVLKEVIKKKSVEVKDSDNVQVNASTQVDDRDQTQANTAISNREGAANVTAAPQERAGDAGSEDSAEGNKTECFGDEVLWAGHCYPYDVAVNRGYINEGDIVEGGIVQDE